MLFGAIDWRNKETRDRAIEAATSEACRQISANPQPHVIAAALASLEVVLIRVCDEMAKPHGHST